MGRVYCKYRKACFVYCFGKLVKITLMCVIYAICLHSVFRSGTHLYMSLFLSVRQVVRPSCTISQDPYIIWSKFWYTCVKWWYLQAFFSFFLNFDFSGSYKNYICHAPYLRNSIAYDHDFWYTCVKWCYLQEFFSYDFHLWYRCVKW